MQSNLRWQWQAVEARPAAALTAFDTPFPPARVSSLMSLQERNARTQANKLARRLIPVDRYLASAVPSWFIECTLPRPIQVAGCPLRPARLMA